MSDLDPATGDGTGFTFERYDRWALYTALVRALDSYRRKSEWQGIQKRAMTRNLSWQLTAEKYLDLYRFALAAKISVIEREANLAREIERTVQIMATLPERIKRLRDLAYNLWCSWHDDAWQLWQRIDAGTWESSHHNPVELLRAVSTDRLGQLAQDDDFLKHYDRVLSAFDGYMHPSGTWFESTYPYAGDRQVAYFSAEFGFHETLPIAAGVPVGASVWCLSHPSLDTEETETGFYTFTQGIVCGKFRLRVTDTTPVDVLAITADYAKGSSGGPILNEHGAVVGIICQTRALFHDTDETEPQLTWKFSRPASSLLALLKASDKAK